ncbi:MAG: metalloregulator ArsR/SmtB family transcription factor [Rhodocyclaceae bacterium]|nr:metalloregulator ArsR/SmtB family transcription factor [Rhodocyclaceae bacterium]MCB1962018.1 metalloregulator ArsR/SmtB family transcription factor [Rhodocyclaceae bacterium]
MQAVKALSALAQETRLAIFRLLVRRGPGGVAAGEVAVQLDVAPNTLSFHFRTLVEAGLVRATQDGRFVHYAADIPAMLELLDFLTAECCEEDPSCCASMRDGARVAPLLRPLAEAAGAAGVFKVLVLCTGNSARSILAEALINAMGAGRVRAWSAGSQPAGRVNPLALAVLAEQGVDTAGLASKSWDVFAAADAPRFDLVVTVCANAAGEVCPVWRGAPLATHWGLPDPAAVEGSEALRRAAFVDTLQALRRRISLLLRLPLTGGDPVALQRQLDAIGRIDEGAA